MKRKTKLLITASIITVLSIFTFHIYDSSLVVHRSSKSISSSLIDSPDTTVTAAPISPTPSMTPEATAPVNTPAAATFKPPSKDSYLYLSDFSDSVTKDGDWSKAISKAESAAQKAGKDLFISNGEYLICHPLIKLSGVNWIGESNQAIFFFDDRYEFKDHVNSNYIIVNEHYYKADTTADYDTFQIKNMTFSNRYTSKSDFYIEGFFGISYTKDVTIDHVTMDQDYEDAPRCRSFDFRGGNRDTTISSCYCVYNSIDGKWGSFTVRNFRKEESTGVTIKNNTIIRRCGLDEPGWICANIGNINNIVVTNNTYSIEDRISISSVISIQQGDSFTKEGTHEIHNIEVTNNKITAPNLYYAAIRVGSYLDGYTPIDQVLIEGNSIECNYKENDDSNQTTGIICQNTTNSTVKNNTIIGTCKTYISYADTVSGNTILEKGNTSNMETRGITYCNKVSENSITVSGIGFVSCPYVNKNEITCDYNYVQSNEKYSITDNIFHKVGNTKDYFIGNNVYQQNGSLSKPLIELSGNLFYGYNEDYIIGSNLDSSSKDNQFQP